MKLNEVVSSTVKAIGYDDNENDLIVQFNGGTKYKYLKVPKNIYEDFLNSESKGVFMNVNIKNKYIFEKLGD